MEDGVNEYKCPWCGGLYKAEKEYGVCDACYRIICPNGIDTSALGACQILIKRIEKLEEKTK